MSVTEVIENPGNKLDVRAFIDSMKATARTRLFG